jgi:hypothetical protein
VLLSSVVELGDSMPKTGNCRRNVGDVGDMFEHGYRSKSEKTIYKPTFNPRTATAMKDVSNGVLRHM